MTSDARERLREALREWKANPCADLQVEDLARAAEALLAEPPAPAHADHDALTEVLIYVEHARRTHDSAPLCNIEHMLRERIARPRAVPDAGALLRELRAWIPDHSEESVDGVYWTKTEQLDRKLDELELPLARAPQPQQDAGALLRELREWVQSERMLQASPGNPGHTCGVPKHAKDINRQALLRVIDAMLDRAPQPQPAPEEPSPTVEKEWLDAHGEHRREQAQASEATDYETLPLHELRRRAEERDALLAEVAELKAWRNMIRRALGLEPLP